MAVWSKRHKLSGVSFVSRCNTSVVQLKAGGVRTIVVTPENYRVTAPDGDVLHDANGFWTLTVALATKMRYPEGA